MGNIVFSRPQRSIPGANLDGLIAALTALDEQEKLNDHGMSCDDLNNFYPENNMKRKITLKKDTIVFRAKNQNLVDNRKQILRSIQTKNLSKKPSASSFLGSSGNNKNWRSRSADIRYGKPSVDKKCKIRIKRPKKKRRVLMRSKILRSCIQGPIKPNSRKLSRQGGLKRIPGLIYENAKGKYNVFRNTSVARTTTNNKPKIAQGKTNNIGRNWVRKQFNPKHIVSPEPSKVLVRCEISKKGAST